MNRSDRGRWAEDLACHYLQARGLSVLERNYHCRRGEIDLVMQDGETVVFVEVRYRSSKRFGGALGSIDARKQARILAAARHYLHTHGTGKPARLDVIAIMSDKKIDWIPNAFEASA